MTSTLSTWAFTLDVNLDFTFKQKSLIDKELLSSQDYIFLLLWQQGFLSRFSFHLPDIPIYIKQWYKFIMMKYDLSTSLYISLHGILWTLSSPAISLNTCIISSLDIWSLTLTHIQLKYLVHIKVSNIVHIRQGQIHIKNSHTQVSDLLQLQHRNYFLYIQLGKQFIHTNTTTWESFSFCSIDFWKLLNRKEFS